MKNTSSFLAGVGATLLALTLAVPALAAYQRQATLDYTGIQITLDGQAVTPTDASGTPVEPFAIEGTTYLPVRGIANALGLEVDWDQASQTVILTTAPRPAGSYHRDHPAPLGTVQSTYVESIYGNYTASVQLLESIRGEAAVELLQKASSLNANSQPAQGMEFIIVKVRVSVDSAQQENEQPMYHNVLFTPYSGTGVKLARPLVLVTPSPAFEGSVLPGGTLEGYVVFQAGIDDPAPKVRFGGESDGTGGIWFSLV